MVRYVDIFKDLEHELMMNRYVLKCDVEDLSIREIKALSNSLEEDYMYKNGKYYAGNPPESPYGESLDSNRFYELVRPMTKDEIEINEERITDWEIGKISSELVENYDGFYDLVVATTNKRGSLIPCINGVKSACESGGSACGGYMGSYTINIAGRDRYIVLCGDCISCSKGEDV